MFGNKNGIRLRRRRGFGQVFMFLPVIVIGIISGDYIFHDLIRQSLQKQQQQQQVTNKKDE